MVPSTQSLPAPAEYARRLLLTIVALAGASAALVSGWALIGHAGSTSGALPLRDTTAPALRASFDGSRLAVSGWDGVRLTLGSPALGRGGSSTVRPGLGRTAFSGGRFQISGRQLSEWFAHSPLGIEQGFTLTARPAGPGPLVISQSVSGGVSGRMDGRAVMFTSRAGALRYEDLTVTDAHGRRVPASLGIAAHRLTITIRDDRAVYPLRVDPTIQQTAGLLTPYDSTTGAGTGTGTGTTGAPSSAPAIASGASASFSVGAAGTFTVISTGYPTAALSDGGASLPSGVTFVDNGDGTATLSGTPAEGSAGVYPFTVTASNGVSPDANQSFTLTVEGASAITSEPTASFSVGAAGAFTVISTGYPTAALSDGGASLPSGVMFVDNGDGTATLSGTPAEGSAGVYPFTVTASNGVSPDASQSFTLTVTEDSTTPVATATTTAAGGVAVIPQATIVTGGVSDVTATSAMLKWMVDPEGNSLYSYAVSCDPLNGSLHVVRATGSTPPGAVPADDGAHSLQTPVTGLRAGTAYTCGLSMGDTAGHSYGPYPEVESVTTLTPAFSAFSGIAEAAGQLSWSVDPEGDALSGYALSCLSAAGRFNSAGGIAAGTLPADELSHALTLEVKRLAQDASYSCTLSLTDADGATFTDSPRTVLTSSVNVPTSITSNGLFVAFASSCGGSARTPCTGSGEDLAGSAAPFGQARGHQRAAAAAVVVGRFQFRIRAHHRGTILFRLTAAGHRLVVRNHGLATTMVMTVRIRGRKLTYRTPLAIVYEP